jgi:hypothetical protein
VDNNQFAQTVKQKYPQYANIPNDQLTQAVLKKYPMYQRVVTPTAGLGGVTQNPQAPMRQGTPPPVAQAPSQQGQQPFNGMDQGKLLGLYAQAYPQQAQELIGKLIQQKMGGQQLNPLQQSQVQLNQAKAANLQGQGQQAGAAAYVNSSGDVSLTPQPGYQPVTKQQLQYVGVSKSTREKNAAYSSRAEAYQRGIDVRQIDRLAETVGITPAQRNLLQQNNMRASRAIELSSKPMTWQEFGAVTTDAAAIMQGGSPQVQQLHDMAYPSWKQDLARAQTYMASTPTANVPDEFKNRIIGMIQGIQKVDNRYLEKNAEFQQKMLAPTIRGGIGQFKRPIQSMTNTITSGGNVPQGTMDMSKMSDDELQRIAAGGP